MGADDYGRVGFARDGGDNAVLAPRVLEVFGTHVVFCAGFLDGAADLAEEPLAGLTTIVGLSEIESVSASLSQHRKGEAYLVVAGVERCEGLEMVMHLRLRQAA